ncbi:MAG: NAD(P)H-dependent oxidoreductase subunit E [Gammaproteobacteria bacterium]|nr:NAD(P)H-dependent oxidoreductase subunit E [Gammaproteobacteria bacterium]
MTATGPRRKKRLGRNRTRQVDSDDRQSVLATLGDMPIQRDLLIEYLHQLQDRYGHITGGRIVALADLMKLAPAEIYEVATFYHHFDIVTDGEPIPPDLTVRVCDSVTCELFGSEALISSLQANLGNNVRVQRVPCVGRCDEAPVAVVGKNPISRATVAQVSDAIRQGSTAIAVQPDWIGVEEYRRGDGYRTYEACRVGSLSHDHILDELDGSDLRGLGGAGFPAGKKWRILKDQPAPRLMAVNIDEGEPGTFKDRYYLERDPHRFIEGMLIAAEVIGIDCCYLYVRDEYPGVLQILEEAVKELGPILDGKLPEIHLRRGAGAYICGEESAMIESIEGKRGMPRLRPPYVAEVGLFGRPTLEHNCETLYWVRDILERGASWFSGQGRRGRRGLRSFSVSGRVNNPGVHLAPAGISVKELIDEFCGGMLDGHTFRAYFPGGASGGILPASLGDEPLDFDTLQAHGSFIGSAAVIILSDQDSPRQAALNTMRFFSRESCGQCTPCRVGCDRAERLMESPKWDTDLLEELACVMEDASICGLGQAAPNPIRTVIRYFPEDVGAE